MLRYRDIIVRELGLNLISHTNADGLARGINPINSESNVHSPNEKFLYRYFDAGIDTAAALYTELGKL